MMLAQQAQQTVAESPGAAGDGSSRRFPMLPGRRQLPPLNAIAPGKGTTAGPERRDVFDSRMRKRRRAACRSRLPRKQHREPRRSCRRQGEGPEAFTLHVQTNFVEVPFTVKDNKGRLVPGLTWRDVRVYENGLRQQMALFTVDPFPSVGGAGDRPEHDLRQHDQGQQCPGSVAGSVCAL